jgi:hypothetical protein
MKFLLVIILTLLMQVFYAQTNLIPNNSLEDHTDCPWGSAELYKAIGWYGIGSVEYFHPCSPYLSVRTPKNSFGFQIPRTGQAYGGFNLAVQMYGNFIPHEIAGAKLMQTLEKKWYCGGYYVSLVNGAKRAIDAFQMYFTVDSLYFVNAQQYWNILPLPAQVTYKNGIITDTLNWVNIEGSFLAQGNERFMQIGCFKDSMSINGTNVPGDPNVVPPFGSPSFVYYYFDDAYLYELNKLPTAQNHAYNCAAQTVTLRADTGFNFRWYYLPDTVNVLSTADTFVVDASTAKHVLLRATLCSTEFSDTVLVPKLDCTGLENNALAQGASLFPNPASSLVTFSLQGMPPPGTRLHLTDLNGRELRSYAVTGKTTEMDVSTLANGVYFVSYRYKENVIWKGKLCKFGE